MREPRRRPPTGTPSATRSPPSCSSARGGTGANDSWTMSSASRDAAEHPVGDREQQRTEIFVGLGQMHPRARQLVVCHGSAALLLTAADRSGCSTRARARTPRASSATPAAQSELALRLRVRRRRASGSSSTTADLADYANRAEPARARGAAAGAPSALGQMRAATRAPGPGRRRRRCRRPRCPRSTRGDGRRGRVVDVDERPDARAVADERELPLRGSARAYSLRDRGARARRGRRSGARCPSSRRRVDRVARGGGSRRATRRWCGRRVRVERVVLASSPARRCDRSASRCSSGRRSGATPTRAGGGEQMVGSRAFAARS